jgi:hypothetical protein
MSYEYVSNRPACHLFVCHLFVCHSYVIARQTFRPVTGYVITGRHRYPQRGERPQVHFAAMNFGHSIQFRVVRISC